MPFFYYYDPYYWMILVPAMLIALLAQLNVSSTFNRYSRMASRRGFTGAQAAEAVLRAHGIQNVRIERVSGRLTDHYDPRSNVIRLSDAVYGSNSIASVGVAAHEAGHAVQYAVGYGPIKLRSALVPICNIGSQLSPDFDRHRPAALLQAPVRRGRAAVCHGGGVPACNAAGGVQRLPPGHCQPGGHPSAGGR